MYDEIGADDFLMGGGVAWAKFPTIGSGVTGTIITPAPKVRQAKDFDSGEPLTWPDGQPVQEVVINLQTDERDVEIPNDTGVRQLVIKAPAMKAAIRDAVREAGGKGLQLGAVLTVTYTGDAAPKKKGYHGAKQYSAVFTPGRAADVEKALGSLGAVKQDDTAGF